MSLRILFGGIVCALSVVHLSAVTFSDEQCSAEVLPGFDSFELTWNEVPSAVSYRVYRTIDSETELMGETSELVYLVSDYALADVTVQVKWVSGDDLETDYCSIVIPKYELIYAEYFVDVDPGQGEGIEVPVEEGQSSSLEFSFDVGADVDEGMASIHFRYQDNRGLWTSEFVARIMGTQKLVGENYSLVYYSKTAGDWVPVESTVSQGDDVSFEFSSGAEGMQKPAFMLQSDEGHLSFPETVIYLSEKQAAVDGNATLAYRVEGNGEESSGVQNQVSLSADVEVLVAPEVSEGIDYEVLLELLGSNGVNAWPARFSIDVDENLPPEADPGKDLVVYEYDGDNRKTVTLDGSASSDPESEVALYLWEWDGGSVEGEIVQIDLALGTTSIRLTVSDEFGVTASDDILVEVVDLDFDDDGLQDSFEMYIADSDPDDGIVGIADVDGDGNFDGDEYTNLEEQTNLSDPTVVTVIELKKTPVLRVTIDSDGSLKFVTIFEDKGHYRLLTGQLGVDVSQWDLLAEGDYDSEVLDYYTNVPKDDSFFAMAVEETPDSFQENIDDEELPVEVFQVEATGLPLFPEANTEYDLKLDQVEGWPGQSRINGEYELVLVPLIGDDSVDFEYSIDPPFVNLVEGVSVSKIKIQTSGSLYNVGIVLKPAIASISSFNRTASINEETFLVIGDITLPVDSSKYIADSYDIWYYPAEEIVSVSGAFGEYPFHNDLHWGFDLGSRIGEVYAANRGIVVGTVDPNGSANGSVLIDHGNGYFSKYLHVIPGVSYGAIVNENTQIATLNPKGSPKHLHFELWKSGRSGLLVSRSSTHPRAGENPINFLARDFNWKHRIHGYAKHPWRESYRKPKEGWVKGIYFSKYKPLFAESFPVDDYSNFDKVDAGSPSYVIVNAMEYRGGNRLAMQKVAFFSTDSDGVESKQVLEFLDKNQVESMGLEGTDGTMGVTNVDFEFYIDKNGKEKKKYIDPYRYWFEWDLPLQEPMLGPRSFEVLAKANLDDSGVSKPNKLTLGPEIEEGFQKLYLKPIDGLNTGEIVLNLICFNGPYPESQKTGFLEDEYVFEVLFENDVVGISRKVLLKDMNGGSWKEVEDFSLNASIDFHEETYVIGVLIEDLLVTAPAEDELILKVRSKRIPSIGHEVRIPIESNTNDLILTDASIDWQLVADSKTVNGQGDPIGLLNDPKGVLTFEDFQNGPSGLPLATSINTRFGSFITDALYINWASSGNTFDFNVRGTVYISSYLSEYGPTDNFVSAEGELELVNNSGGDRDILVTVESYLNNLFYSVGNPWPINTVSFFENNYNEKRPHAVATVSTPGGAFHRFDLTNKAPPTPETYRVSKLKNGETLRIDLSHVGMNYSTRTGTFFNIKVEMLDPVTVEE